MVIQALLGLSNSENSPRSTMAAFRELENSIQQNERFSKHGRYFTPFHQSLSSMPATDSDYPLLLSVPFLDWSIDGPTPPLRFQVDPRENYISGRSSAHLLRSILQYFYRLEDTNDREHKQVFNRHKPWATDRDLDLKVRRWYGRHPTALIVDEIWILAIDERHVVTFSSNQSWKSRWPPLQLASRIAEVSFRAIRNSLLLTDKNNEYSALTHMVACLSGAVGILHRSFWTDIPLCLTDRYAGYLSHLVSRLFHHALEAADPPKQYRLYRAPSTKLVMDLLQVQEELNIIIQITQQQTALMEDIQLAWYQHRNNGLENQDRFSIRSRAASQGSAPGAFQPSAIQILSGSEQVPVRKHPSSVLTDPMTQLVENLHRELTDLHDLRDNSNNLVNRTIQLVNIRLEDHGKAILVFTIVTIVFLPLSFVSSFFGMNVRDIRNLEQSQWLFWAVASATTIAVVGFALFFAFYGGTMYETFVSWRDEREKMARYKGDRLRVADTLHKDIQSFRVFSASRSDKWA